ncbi:carboxypeptidase B-like isoform X2 [Mobula birostris]|uniref:carboxypeptidase B-like isoform X2 n=1 Tax=Mobula birostris TaxID=1983395 RepID=UPI003B28B489
MKGLLLLGFVAAVIGRVPDNQYARDKVLRLKPENEQHLQFLRDMAPALKMDFWQPSSLELVTTNSTVDLRVPATSISETHFRLKEIGLKYDVLIDDMKTLMENQFDQKDNNSTCYNYEKYHRWIEIESWMKKITYENPRLISLFRIGRSYENRSIYILRVGKRTHTVKPTIFMDCGIHAREWISPAFCQWFVMKAVQSFGTNCTMDTLLNKLDFLIVPVINVDGYVYSWTKDRLWRKTRSRNPGTTCVGTDPNRNFDAKWCCEFVPLNQHSVSKPLVLRGTHVLRLIVDPMLSLSGKSRLWLMPSVTTKGSRLTSQCTRTLRCVSFHIPTRTHWLQTTRN